MSLLSKLFKSTDSKKSRASQTQYEQWSTPTLWRNEDGVYIGENGQAWMYRTLDMNPVKWEDNEARLGIGRQLENLASDLGQLSKNPIGGIRALAMNREFHIESITWQEILTSPEENPPALVEFQQDAYGMTIPQRALFFGVKLNPSIMGEKKDAGSKSVYRSMEQLVRRAMADDVPKMDLFKEDFAKVAPIFGRHDAKIPTTEEFAQLESWFNYGMGTDVLVEEQQDKLIVADGTPIQISAIREFGQSQMQAPADQWLMDTLSHPGDAPHVISIRGELEPPKSTRERARISQRRIQANIEEEEASGDIERPEDSDSFRLAKELEGYLASERRPILTAVSMLMVREISEETETYMDFLDTNYGIQMTTLEHRQILALDETLPASDVRVNPFLQDMNVPMLANAGLQAFSALGDDRGCFVGFVDPDGSPLFIDPSASSRQNLPPAFGVFGDPGSGKSSPVDTPVFNVTGSLTTMGALRPGDYIPGADGETVRVETIHPQGTLKTYRVTLADGRTLKTSAQHLWHVLNGNDDSNTWENRELGTFMNDLYDAEGTPKYFAPVPRPLAMAEADHAVDPYLVGAAAVMGMSAASIWQITDTEEVDLLAWVDENGVIPNEYLAGSVAQRVSLLQGLMDVSGTVAGEYLEAVDLSPEVAGQLIQLVRSLGGIAYDPEEVEDKVTIALELPCDIAPFRQAEVDDAFRVDAPLQYILPIESVGEDGEDEHVCITVDSVDHLYTSGDYVVTHNTFFAQNFATQCVLYGLPVFFINPKAADPLTGLVDYINEETPASAKVTSIMSAEEEDGEFDPFRFANDATYAAEVAGKFILSALSTPQEPLKQDIRLSLESGLKKGALAGAGCVWEALDYIVNVDHRTYIKNLVEQQMEASSLFSLGIAKKPRGRMNMANNHLSLVSFDREIGLPSRPDPSQYEISERIAIATVNLVTKAALEVLIKNKGGVLILDEAWTFLSQPESLSVLERISREGRSLNIVPVFLTQRIKDVISRDLEGFLSRVLVLKLNEKAEAEAAISICGLQPTKERLAMLREAGPKPPKDGRPAVWAQGLFRDLHLRHSWVALGPTPEAAMKAWSTNPDDKRKFEEEKLRQMEEQAAGEAGNPIYGGSGLAELAEAAGLSEADLAVQPATRPTPEEADAVGEETEGHGLDGSYAQETAEPPAPKFNKPVPSWEKPAAAPETIVEPAPEPEPAASPFAKPTPSWAKPAPEVPAAKTQQTLWAKPAE